MDLFDLPGNLGPIRGNLLALHHADWPAYPAGEDWFEALFQFCAFPGGVRFSQIDDIDRSILFRAEVKCGTADDPFDPKNFHLAAWHDDLTELHRRHYVSGIALVTERRWHQLRWQELTKDGPLARITPEGPVPIPTPNWDNYDNDDEFPDLVRTERGHITVTDLGRLFIRGALRERKAEILEAHSEKIRRIFELGFYDTCIREACVTLEDRIKDATKCESWGDRLTEAYIDLLRSRKEILESAVRTFRQELRSVFKLIRNDFMHNLSTADEGTALVILARISRLSSLLPAGKLL